MFIMKQYIFCDSSEPFSDSMLDKREANTVSLRIHKIQILLSVGKNIESVTFLFSVRIIFSSASLLVNDRNIYMHCI